MDQQKLKKKKLVPSLRFFGFDGEWEEKRLGEVLNIERGGSPRPIQNFITKSKNGVPWIKIGDIEEGAKFIISTKEKIIPEGVKKSRKVKIGDFILSNSMSFGRPYILKINGCIHDGWLALRNEKKNIILDEFLYELLTTDKVKRKFLSLAAGSTVKNLKSETVKFTKVLFPSVSEQQKIASFLSKIDELLENLKEQKTKWERYKKGLMQKLFPQKNERIPRLRFPGFDGEWDEKRLGEVVEFWNGKAHEKDISKSGYIVVNSKFVSTNGAVIKYSTKQISPLQKDDIVIVMSDIPNGKAIAKCFLIDENNKYTLNQRIGGLKSDKIISNFLIKIVNRNKYFLGFDNGVSQTNLRKDEILNCPIKFPSLPEQQKIASFLSSIDEIIENKEKQIEQVEKWKKGLMQRMFV